MNRNYKILIVGDTFVGKTSLVQEYIGNKFSDNYHPTIEDIYTKTVNINNEKLDIKFYDISLELLNIKQSQFQAPHLELNKNSEVLILPTLKNCKSEPIISTSYITTCDAFIFVYSIANRKSFSTIKELLDIIYTNNCKNKDINKPMYVIGTKLDLSEKREITKKEGTTLSLEYNAFHFETSVITCQNIERSLQTIIRNAVASNKQNLITRSSSMYTPTIEKGKEKSNKKLITRSSSMYTPIIEKGKEKSNRKSITRSSSMHTSTLEKIDETSNQKANNVIIIDTHYKNEIEKLYTNITRSRSKTLSF